MWCRRLQAQVPQETNARLRLLGFEAGIDGFTSCLATFAILCDKRHYRQPDVCIPGRPVRRLPKQNLLDHIGVYANMLGNADPTDAFAPLTKAWLARQLEGQPGSPTITKQLELAVSLSDEHSNDVIG